MSKTKTGQIAFLANPKSRMVVVAVVVVLIAGLALAINGVLKKNAMSKDQAESTSTAALPANTTQKAAIDPNKVDAKQSELRKAANDEGAKQADSNGQTFIATMRPEAMTAAENNKNAIDPSMLNWRQQEQLGFRRNTQNEPSEQDIRDAEAAHRKRVDEYKRRLSADKSIINEAWDPGSRVFYTGYVGSDRVSPENTAAPSTTNAVAKNESRKASRVIAKAGEVFYGMIDIGLNTDEPSAVTAYILSGPLKGGKLIGALAGQTAPYSEKAVIQFTALSHPAFERTIAVKIFAVDRNTRRAAVADNVDRHLLAKFGLAAAVDFAQGYAEGKAQNNSTIVFGQNGAPTVVTQSELTNKQLIARGAARTMGRVANTLAPYTNRPNTLEVYSQTEIGLLVVGDIVYTEGQYTDNASPPATPLSAENRSANPYSGNQPQPAPAVPQAAPLQQSYGGPASVYGAQSGYSQAQIYLPQTTYPQTSGYPQPGVYPQQPAYIRTAPGY